MKAAPVVSVVMAVHNREGYVAQAVDSILGQTLGDLELIAVDDGSTDGSPEILADYAARDSRVRVHRQRNAGVSTARNAGIALARGEFVALMDSDDVSLPQRLEKQVAFLNENPKFGVICLRCDLIDRNGKLIKRQKPRRPEQEPGMVPEKFRGGMLFVNATAMLRRSILKEQFAAGSYRPFFPQMEDLDFTLRLMEKYWIGQLNDDAYYQYRHFPSHTTANQMGRDPVSLWHCICAAWLSSHARRSGREDPVNHAQSPRDLMPQVAQLPAAIKSLLIKDASTEVRRLIASGRAADIADILDGLEPLATEQQSRRDCLKTQRKILFYAVAGGKWKVVPRIARSIAAVRRRGL